MNGLSLFHPITAEWFSRAIGSPTAVQEQAWPAIAAGGDTLVSAPTGTGKTLSAFLVFIDRMKAQARVGELKKELQLIYVSPLKSLAGDIRENLRRPLDGIAERERFEIEVAIRTGDTTQHQRRRMIKSPPHILITTPESLYLLLTSGSGANMLRTARFIILDELHALIDNKRGAHLMLSLARLDRLCGRPLQRIGLSATIEPLELAAEYLSPGPVTIVAPKMHKEVLVEVRSPIGERRAARKDSIWQEIAAAIYAECAGARTAIAFVEGRALAERLSYYVNQIGGEDFARTHHGSLSKEQRFRVEEALRSGRLRLLCATSSMELGIDVGEIDRVFQVGPPRSISSAMQRLGRAGHKPGVQSVMKIFPRTATESLFSGLAAEVVRTGGVEDARPPRLCLDVLAQHLVSMATGEGYSLREVLEILPRAYPFRQVTEEDLRAVLEMLAGDYEHQREILTRPRVLYDREQGRVTGDAYSRILAVSAAGTIPDRGLYTVRSESGLKLGELDEEFVFEARIGDKFLLGSFAWKIQDIQKDTVVVTGTGTGGARPPFWKGDPKGRRLRTGLNYGKILRELDGLSDADALQAGLRKLGLDDACAQSVRELIQRQRSAAGSLPDDRTLVVEQFCDETGREQWMVHSVFGRGINEPLAILASELAKAMTRTNIGYVAEDDGFLLFPYENCHFPERLLEQIDGVTAEQRLAALLPSTQLFQISFRYNAARALMMGVRKSGRQPLWVQRMRSADLLEALLPYEAHPLIRETKRECLEDIWDLVGLTGLLESIQSGAVRVRSQHLDAPSPMSLPFRQKTEAAMMYDYTPMPRGIHLAVGEALKKAGTVLTAAQREQIRSLRGEIKTLPPERYAALLASRTQFTAPPEEKLERTLISLQGVAMPPALWESTLLPARIAGYRPELLDKLLAKGHVLWRLDAGGNLAFIAADRMDWEADLPEREDLPEELRTLYQALLKRGASFSHGLSGLLGGASPLDALMDLLERGIVYADSFVPVRHWLSQTKLEKTSVRQRVRARATALNAGRWSLVRPLVPQTPEQILEGLFDQVEIVCRETVRGISWADALEVLRLWEYTGRVRRGYFIRDLSGIQFIRAEAFEGIRLQLEHPDDAVIWLSAADPAQAWGKILPHMPDRSFLPLPGTAVALRAGLPVAVFERQGNTLRVFDDSALEKALQEFVREYAAKRLFPAANRLTVRSAPQHAAGALTAAGFKPEMNDFVLYRGL